MKGFARSLIVITAGLAAWSLPGDARAQQPAAALKYADGSPQPVTPWGDPDLQGMWPIMHLFATNLQRNPQYGDRRQLTDDEGKNAEGVLQAAEQNNHPQIANGKMNMGHWAETTTRTDAARLTS